MPIQSIALPIIILLHWYIDLHTHFYHKTVIIIYNYNECCIAAVVLGLGHILVMFI